MEELETGLLGDGCRGESHYLPTQGGVQPPKPYPRLALQPRQD